MNNLQKVVEQFALQGDVVDIKKINKGYINSTYRIETVSKSNHTHKYLLQRINTNVFENFDALMSNFRLITEHLAKNLEMPGQHKHGPVHKIYPTKDGKLYYVNGKSVWRVMKYLDNTYSLDIPNSSDLFYYAGVSFGRFIKAASSVDISEIYEVIPDFHNTKKRYLDLEEVISRNPCSRVEGVSREIAYIRANTDLFGKISDALESGKIPTRVCHNDCNLNNILFDRDTHLPVAIIDLDTVMPSSPLYDFGDSMRIGTNTAKDDEKDLSKVSCNLDLYEKYARGYMEACGDILTREELELFPYAALIITAEDGIRFLMDHINGDTYYHIDYPGQNLDRARTQLKLLDDMKSKISDIRRILQKIYDELGLLASVR